MAEVKIDGKTYDTDKLTKEQLNNLEALRFTDLELQRATASISVLKTARNTYASALKSSLSKEK